MEMMMRMRERLVGRVLMMLEFCMAVQWNDVHEKIDD